MRVAIQHIFECVENGQLEEAANTLEGTESLPFERDYIDTIVRALRSNIWTGLETYFLNEQFITSEGYCFFLAPYRRYRSGLSQTKITGFLGFISFAKSSKQILELANQKYGPLYSSSKLLGYRALATCGFAGGVESEAFLVPNAWELKNSEFGPSLNNMTEQICRSRLGVSAINKLFCTESAKLLTGVISDQVNSSYLQNLEFQYHEVGHSTGIGFAKKIQNGFFINSKNCALEEWRSDGVAFDLMGRLESPEIKGKLVAANLALRVAVDAQRTGIETWDADELAAGLTFITLLKTGAMNIRGNKFSLDVNNYSDLGQAVNVHSGIAIQLTKDELAGVKNLKSLYDNFEIDYGLLHSYSDVLEKSNQMGQTNYYG